MESSCIGECNVHGSVRINEQNTHIHRKRERERERESTKKRKRGASRNEGSEDENGATLAS